MHEGIPNDPHTSRPESEDFGLTLSELLHEITDDPELEQFFSENSNLPLNPDGTSSIARDPFQLAYHLSLHDEEKARRFVDLLAEHGFLPELHYEYQSEGLTESELAHNINLNRFESARENFYTEEASPIERAMVTRSKDYLGSIRESFGLRPLNNVDQYVSTTTEPCNKKDEGFGVLSAEVPMVVVNTPEDISSLKFVFHELTHVHAFSLCTFTINLDDKISSVFSKAGLSTFDQLDRKGRAIRKLSGLNEAVVEELSKRFIQSIPEDDADFGEIIQDQKRKIESYRENHPDEFSLEGWSDVVAIHELGDGTEYPAQYTYREERLMLQQLLTEMSRRLHAESPERDEEEIHEKLFQALLKAEFTGDLSEFQNEFITVFSTEAYNRYASCITREHEADVLESIGVPGLEGLFEKKDS